MPLAKGLNIFLEIKIALGRMNCKSKPLPHTARQAGRFLEKRIEGL
jgi:hypothetical protein